MEAAARIFNKITAVIMEPQPAKSTDTVRASDQSNLRTQDSDGRGE